MSAEFREHLQNGYGRTGIDHRWNSAYIVYVERQRALSLNANAGPLVGDSLDLVRRSVSRMHEIHTQLQTAGSAPADVKALEAEFWEHRAIAMRETQNSFMKTWNEIVRQQSGLGKLWRQLLVVVGLSCLLAVLTAFLLWIYERVLTLRKEAEAALLESRGRYEALVTSMDGIVWEADGRTFQFGFVSRKAEQLLGYPTERWLEEPGFWAAHIHPEDREWAVDFCKSATRQRRNHQFEYRMITAKGETLWLRDIVTVVSEEGGAVRLCGLMLDITDRKAADEALRRSQERFQMVARATNDAIWDWDMETNSVEWNDSVKTLFGYTAKQVGPDRQWWIDNLHPDDRQPILDDAYALIDSGKDFWSGEYRFRRADGTYAYVLDRGFVIRSPQGKPLRMIGAMVDITARRRAEEELRQSEEQFRRLFEDSPVACHEIDANGVVRRVNRAECTLLGFEASELVGREIWDFVAPEERERSRAAVLRKTSGLQPLVPFHRDYVRRDGKSLVLEIHENLIRGPERQIEGIRSVMLDVTERKRAEKALRESEERYRELFENANDIIYTHDMRGNFISLNKAGERISGYSRDEMPPKNLADIMAPEEVARVRSLIARKPPAGGAPRTEVEIIAKDGRRIPLEVSSRLIFKDGKPVAMEGIARDITERRRAEEAARQAREAAESANRAKSEFVANVSHEIRTPLNGIIGLTQLALETNLTAEQRAYLRAVKDSADSLHTVINDILDFSKIEAGKMSLVSDVFSLSETLSAVLGTFAVHAQRKGLQLLHHGSSQVPDRLMGDPGRLRQILVNLVGNAVKFTDRGSVEVRVECECAQGDAIWLHFSVADTGIGIHSEKRPLIFEAFQQADPSTTRKYGGTGLGLTICAQLVELMDGRIWVDSQEGRGSTFHFTARFGLDHSASLSHIPFAPKLAASAAAPRRRLHILVAEDHPVNQLLARRLLETQGHTVAVASNGLEALAALENETFDLVLMDVQMPELGGMEATERIRERENATGQRIPVIAMTARAMQSDRDGCLQAGMDGYVAKPIVPEQLFAEIQRVGGRERAVPAPPNGDEEMLPEMLKLFFATCPRYLSDIEQGLAASDSRLVAFASHALKGSLSQLSAERAFHAARDLEAKAEQGDLSSARELYLMLQSEIAEFEQQTNHTSAALPV